MEGIKYVQINRIVVDPESADENSPLSAEGSNSIVTENEIWFNPPIPDFSDFENTVNEYNELVADGNWTEAAGSSMYNYLTWYDVASKYSNQYGFVCGVISYRTSQYVVSNLTIVNEDGSLNYPIDEIFDFYDGTEEFWYLQNSKLNSNAQFPERSPYSSSTMPVGCQPIGVDARPRYYQDNPNNEAEKILPFLSWGKLSFYNRSRILCPNQPIAIPCNDLVEMTIHTTLLNLFKPNFTGNNGILPVGLVMLRDIVLKTTQQNLNNFGEYGFVIVMPLFIEPSQVVRGLSLGKEIFVVGNGLKAEVFFAITTDNHSDYNCVISNANLGYRENGNLDVLFSGKNGELRLSSSTNPLGDETISCKNVFHEVRDFSVPGNTNGVFYFNSNITYDMGVTYLVFGMRPYDINGNGKEYPPKENPYGTDTSFLGNYALIDISDKKFYLL